MASALSFQDEVGMELVMATLIAYPDLEKAAARLTEEGYQISANGLKGYRIAFETPGSTLTENFERKRAEMTAKLETKMTGDMLEIARRSTDIERLALDEVERLLKSGAAADPSRILRDVYQVKTQSIDKRNLLLGNPTQITEHRDVAEILRALEALGAVKPVEVDAEAEAVEITDGQ